MIYSVRFICVIDTCVLHPIICRDLLFWFAHYKLFTPKWSRHIFDEWERLLKLKNVSNEDIVKRLDRANLAFPDAYVQNYEGLIDGLELPDENDRHVLAAAIKTNANVIVTENLKDFPLEYLSSFGLSAKAPDDFLTDIIDLNPEDAVSAFRDMVLQKKNPDLNEFDVLEILRNSGLRNTADYLHSQL